MTLEEIFLQAIEKKTRAERDAYLDGACGKNIELRAQVEGLLESHEQADRFLEQPLFDGDSTFDRSSITEKSGCMIGRYKLLQEIGEGGFGVVFMAEQQEPVVRKVALKVIKPGMDSKEVVARFEAERQALAMMDHPNIAKVLDGGQTETERPYFVMELVRGIPITEYCDHNDLTPAQRLELFTTVCNAVQHAHQKGIIHRDLKPSNVLVTLHDGRPVVKVIDFGVAKAIHQRLTNKTLFTGFMRMIGTPMYMSPEQAELSGLDIDTRSDIYSLGVLLYELLVGATPFDKERFREAAYDEMRRIIREEEPVRPSNRLSTLGGTLTDVCAHRKTEPKRLTRLMQGDLDWIVMKALEKDRNRRYETANEMAKDIERHLGDEPVHAGPPTVWYRARKFARRNRGLVGAGSAVAIALLVGLGLALWGFHNAGQARDIAARERDRAILAKQEADRERTRAEAEAQKSKKAAADAELALGVIANALGSETVNDLRGEKQTVQAMLDSLAASLDAKKVRNSFVEANIRSMLGRAYFNAERYNDAYTQLKRAVELQRVLLGEHNGKLNNTRLLAALAADWIGKTEEAEQYIRETIDVTAPNSRLRAVALLRSADVLLARELPEEAHSAAEKALTILRDHFSDSHGDIGWCLNMLGQCKGAMGQQNEKVRYRREALAEFELFGDLNAQWQLWMDLRSDYQLHRDFTEAIAAVTNAIEISPRLGVKRNERFVASTTALADLQRRLDDWSGAESTYRRILRELEERRMTDDKSYVFARLLLAVVLARQGKLAEAQTLCQEITAVCEQSLQNDRTVWSEVTDRVVAAQTAVVFGKADPSQSKFGRQYMQQLKELGLELNPWQQSYADYVESEIAECAGDFSAAISAIRSAWEREYVKESFGLRFCEQRLVTLLRASGQNTEAEVVLQKGLKKRLDEFGEDNIMVAYVRAELAEVLLDLKRPAEAEPLATRAWTRLADEKIVPATKKQFVLQLLVRVCDSSDKPEQADQWRKQLESIANHTPQDAR